MIILVISLVFFCSLLYGQTLLEYNPSIEVTTFSGNGNEGIVDGGPANASFSRIVGGCVDPTGTFLITVSYDNVSNYTVRKVDVVSGYVSTIATGR